MIRVGSLCRSQKVRRICRRLRGAADAAKTTEEWGETPDSPAWRSRMCFRVRELPSLALSSRLGKQARRHGEQSGKRAKRPSRPKKGEERARSARAV
ncbi:hypothetical protein MRX96_038144 [Rhipicephalus microplus]